MSKTPTDIFKQLQQYEVTVPAHLWEQLRVDLFEQHEQDSLHKLRMLDVPLPGHLFEQVMGEVHDLRLKETTSQLQQFELPVPVLLYEQVQKKQQQSAGLLLLLHTKRSLLYSAAAAILFLLTVAIAIRISFVKEKQTETVSAPKQSPSVSASNDTASIVNTVPQTKTGAVEKKHTTDKGMQIKSELYMDVPFVVIAGKRMPVYENDLLFSFTAVSVSNRRAWFRSKDKSVIVKVDDYTNIRVSEFMSKQLNDVFKTKRNGKPAHAAKRAKARISNWRKADRKAFDQHKTKSVHDIIDLTETLF